MSGGVDSAATPQADSDALAIGYGHLYGGEVAAAHTAFRTAAVQHPDDAEVWSVVGETARTLGQWEAACQALERAVRLEPDSWHYGLMLAELMAERRPAQALDQYDQLIARRPDSAAVRRGRGAALCDLGRTDDALGEYREALALEPGNGVTALRLADLLTASGDALGAVEMLQPWLFGVGEGEPQYAVSAARAWIVLGEPDKARRLIDDALAVDPENSDARMLLAGLTDDVGATMTPAYVRALFDRYSERFDHDLVDKLGYVAPALLRDAVDRVRGDDVGALRVLDLGCGSGLAGVAFRSLASHLAGVDLSPRMIDKARARGVYDHLAVGDAVGALNEGTRWDLAVAADVLVYLGDLKALFGALARALQPGGLFTATTERLDNENAAYRLGPSRRYAHSARYVQTTAREAGFVPRLIEDCVPRRERGAPVAGTLHVYARV